MVNASVTGLLLALGAAHAALHAMSEECQDVAYLRPASMVNDTEIPGGTGYLDGDITCTMLSSFGHCSCYVYAGEDGQSNWFNEAGTGFMEGCTPNSYGFTALPAVAFGQTLTEEQGNTLASVYCPGSCNDTCAAAACTDVDFFTSTSGQQIDCATLSGSGQCGCYVYAGEDGQSNWFNEAGTGWMEGCTPSAYGFDALPAVDGTTLTEEQGNMLVSDYGRIPPQDPRGPPQDPHTFVFTRRSPRFCGDHKSAGIFW